MKINSRTIHFFEIELHTLTADKRIPNPPQLAMDVLMPILVAHVPPYHEIKCGKTPIEVTRVHWDGHRHEAHFLLNKPDPDRSDVAYRKRSTRSRRLGNKAVDEDIEVSAHVLIKLSPGSNLAKMLLTVGAAVPPGKVVSLLNEIYKLIQNNKSLTRLRSIALPTNVLGANGKPVTYDVKHKFSFRAMPNGMLTDILRTGKVVGVSLINTGAHAFDSTMRVNVDRMSLHMDVSAESVDLGFIRRLIKVASKKRDFDSDKVRIEYKDSNADDDSNIKNKTFDAARLEEAFTRSESISLDVDHNDHQTDFSSEIIEKMRALI